MISYYDLELNKKRVDVYEFMSKIVVPETPFELFNAVKYIVRAGKKNPICIMRDIDKAWDSFMQYFNKSKGDENFLVYEEFNYTTGDKWRDDAIYAILTVNKYKLFYILMRNFRGLTYD